MLLEHNAVNTLQIIRLNCKHSNHVWYLYLSADLNLRIAV